MKSIGCLSKSLACGVMAAAVFALADAQAAMNKAVVRGLEGTASFSLDRGRSWTPVEVGHIYSARPNTILRTGLNSTLDLYLRDNGPVVRLMPETELSLDRLYINETGFETIIETQLDLRAGRVIGYVKRTSDSSNYEVLTPRGVAGIRGPAEYDIRADGTVYIIEGTALVSYINPTDPASPTIMRVNAGEMATPPAVPGEDTVAPIAPDVLDTIASLTRQATILATQFAQTPDPPVPPTSPNRSPLPEPAVPEVTQPVTLVPEPFISPVAGPAGE